MSDKSLNMAEHIRNDKSSKNNEHLFMMFCCKGETAMKPSCSLSTACLPIAGRGKRLGKTGLYIPKCLLTFEGETLLDYAVSLLGESRYFKLRIHCRAPQGPADFPHPQ